MKNKDHELLLKYTDAKTNLMLEPELYLNNNEIFINYSYFNKGFVGNDLMIGKFDCFLKTSSYNHYVWNEYLTTIWRKIMVKAYNLPYKQELKETLEKRRYEHVFNINANFNSQIKDLEDDTIYID